MKQKRALGGTHIHPGMGPFRLTDASLGAFEFPDAGKQALRKNETVPTHLARKQASKREVSSKLHSYPFFGAGCCPQGGKAIAFPYARRKQERERTRKGLHRLCT